MRNSTIPLLLVQIMILPGCFAITTEEMIGISPIHPMNAVNFTLASQQPNFEWDGEPGKEYDLIVWEITKSDDTQSTSPDTPLVTGSGSSTTGSSVNGILVSTSRTDVTDKVLYSGNVIFEKKGINGQCFQLPIKLTEGKYYRWSVKESGSNQWSSWSANAFAGAMLLGSSANMDGQMINVGFGFYVPRESEIYTRGPSRRK